MKMKIKYYIPQTNDTQKNVSTSFLFQSSRKNIFHRLYSGKTSTGQVEWVSRNVNQFGETPITVERANIRTVRQVKDDPMLGLDTESVKSVLFPDRSNTDRYLNQITFK